MYFVYYIKYLKPYFRFEINYYSEKLTQSLKPLCLRHPSTPLTHSMYIIYRSLFSTSIPPCALTPPLARLRTGEQGGQTVTNGHEMWVAGVKDAHKYPPP